jgi:hypothetical protein
MKIFKILVPCFFPLLICSCENRINNPKENKISREEAINKREVVVSKNDTIKNELSEERQEFVDSYSQFYSIDTVILINDDTLNLKFSHYSLNDNAIDIPEEYIWTDEKLSRFVVSNSQSKIEIEKNGKNIYSEVFGKEKFDPLFTDIIRKYAVMMDPKFRGINKKKLELVFAYNISIPVTDIGTSATLHIDLNGNERITQYDF